MLLLDSEAISALAHGPLSRKKRVLGLIAAMRAQNLPIATVAGVLAEVIRGRREDAAVFASLEREEVVVYPVTREVGIRAGQLLGRAHAGSELAIDAFTVAVADLAGGVVIATADVDDFERLSQYASDVDIADIGG